MDAGLQFLSVNKGTPPASRAMAKYGPAVSAMSAAGAPNCATLPWSMTTMRSESAMVCSRWAMVMIVALVDASLRIAACTSASVLGSIDAVALRAGAHACASKPDESERAERAREKARARVESKRGESETGARARGRRRTRRRGMGRIL